MNQNEKDHDDEDDEDEAYFEEDPEYKLRFNPTSYKHSAVNSTSSAAGAGTRMTPVVTRLFAENATGTADPEDLWEERRSLRCGGCFRLRADRSGQNKKFEGHHLIPVTEYWDSPQAVKIYGVPRNGCTAPDKSVLVFDMRDPGKNTQLGAPNAKCPDIPGVPKGPGVGAGGEPNVAGGGSNKYKNCLINGPSHVFTVKGNDEDDIDDDEYYEPCTKGYSIRFWFKYPVTLNKIGMMDVVEEGSVKITVEREDGSRQKHYGVGGGVNSYEVMGFNGVNRVVKLTVKFENRGGALRWIDYCHQCGDEAAVRKALNNNYYPNPDQRNVENTDSAARFTAMTTGLNDLVSTNLIHALHDQYRTQLSHCLYNTDVGVSTMFEVATPAQAQRC